jgi:glyceraldehyde 3-phosphate dehydrogenase
MATKVGINGFGRIGRNFYRAYLEKNPGFEVVAVNDLADPSVLAHLLKYDSTLGVLDSEVKAGEGEITVDGSSLAVV